MTWLDYQDAPLFHVAGISPGFDPVLEWNEWNLIFRGEKNRKKEIPKGPHLGYEMWRMRLWEKNRVDGELRSPPTGRVSLWSQHLKWQVDRL